MKNSAKILTAMMLTVATVGTLSVFNFVTPTEAVAQSRSSAKAIVDKAILDGVVGETAAGYLALVTGSADPDVRKAMNEINIGRKSLYTSKAREEGVPVEQVAALFGEKQLAAAKSGEKVLTPQGRWVTK